MSASITGLGSGFDIDSWVSQLVAVKQSSLVTPLQTKLSTLQSKSNAVSSLQSKYSTLQSALQTFTKTIYNSSSDMWANTTIESSNSAYATASSAGSIAASNVELEIKQIATATKATSTGAVGNASQASIKASLYTNLANGQAKAGSLTFFVDGRQYSTTIDDNETVSQVIQKIHDDTNGAVEADVNEEGYFTIKATSGRELSIGSSSDTSNFADALKLHVSLNNGAGFISKYGVSTVNVSKAFSDSASGLGAIDFDTENGSKITINGVDFEVNENMDLSTLISKINGNSETGVKASYDALSNKVILTSTKTGSSNIALSEEGTNLLQILKLTEINENGDEVLALGSQKLGDNAIVEINGNEVISSSNTITGESSGIANLSITVKKPTDDNSTEKDAVNSVTLDISPDYTAVKNALKTFVSAYNDVVSTTKNLLASDGTLAHDTSLNSILTQVRGITSMVSNNDGAFSLLADIGISTSKNDTYSLTIDDTKLTKALSENFDSVKQLLSDGYVSQDDNGLFDRMLNTLNGFLDYENGYFTNKTTSYSSQITSLNSRIERANTQLSKYETRITKQFNQMDSLMSSLSAQLATFQSYIG